MIYGRNLLFCSCPDAAEKELVRWLKESAAFSYISIRNLFHMRTIDQLLTTYGESHQHATNKLIHWICVPSIMFSLLTLLFAIPYFTPRTFFANWAFVLLVAAWVYYARLSISMLLGFLIIGGLMLWGIMQLYALAEFDAGTLAIYALVIFVVAWIGQFIGHKIEGKKPSFLQDVQFLLIGPAWLLHFIFKKLKINY